MIEDLHWADASTRAFLRFLAATLSTERLLIVATYRPDELHRRHPLRPLLAELERVRALRIELAGLSRDELAEQLGDILGAAPDAALVERLYARSEGNPLFTEELLAAGTDGRGVAPAEPRRGAGAADRAGSARRAGGRPGARPPAACSTTRCSPRSAGSTGARSATGCARRSRRTSSCSTASAARSATR